MFYCSFFRDSRIHGVGLDNEMSPEELIFDAALVTLAVYIGWLFRGVAGSFKTRREIRAWKRARHFLPSDTSKD